MLIATFARRQALRPHPARPRRRRGRDVDDFRRAADEALLVMTPDPASLDRRLCLREAVAAPHHKRCRTSLVNMARTHRRPAHRRRADRLRQRLPQGGAGISRLHPLRSRVCRKPCAGKAHCSPCFRRRQRCARRSTASRAACMAHPGDAVAARGPSLTLVASADFPLPAIAAVGMVYARLTTRAGTVDHAAEALAREASVRGYHVVSDGYLARRFTAS